MLLLCLLLTVFLGTTQGAPLATVWTFDNYITQNVALPGQSIDRIVGGNAVSPPNRYRFPVRLQVTTGYGAAARTSVCGGSLITARAVLTAAHCINDPGISKVTAIVGVHDVISRVPASSSFVASSWIVHPSYELVSADIGIVVLRSAVPETTGKPVPLDYDSVDKTPLLQNATVPTLAALGWGGTNPYDVSGSQSNTLNIVRLFHKTTRECKRVMGSVIKEDEHICAIGSRTTYQGVGRPPVEVVADTCAGDSGGPLLLSLNPTLSFEPQYAAQARATYNLGCSLCGAPFLGQVVGIVSFGGANSSDGRGCAVNSSYGVYTRVSKYTPWIEAELSRAGVGTPLRSVPLRAAWLQNLFAPPTRPPPTKAPPPSRGNAPLLPQLTLALSTVNASSSFDIANIGCSAVSLEGASIAVGAWTSFLSGTLDPGETLVVCDSAILSQISRPCGTFAPFGAVARGTSVMVVVPGSAPWESTVDPKVTAVSLRPAERCRR